MLRWTVLLPVARLAKLARAVSISILPTGCSGWQSALDPHGSGAAETAWLFWLLTAVSVAVWLLVMAALAFAVVRRPAIPAADPLAVEPGLERRRSRAVAAAVAATAGILVALAALSFLVQGKIFGPAPGELVIRLTGHQWWWEVRYEDVRPDLTFSTANEIHVPVGRPVRVVLESADVIHSFWVPSLMGKMDLVPGRRSEVRFTALQPGVYRGQCAEFCGLQHARMALLVVASPAAAFDAWRTGQIAAAAPPASAEGRQGQAAFMSNGCMLCHTIRGTAAGGRVGPDLTHVGSRRTIAAGTLPMTSGHLAAWIADPQGVKPGVRMPRVGIGAGELTAIAGYLLGLE